MNRYLSVLVVALAATATAPQRAPILVELFTSEGCSSCPPADRLLTLLEPEVIVLGEHVDYWDHQGWRDRWSSRANTLRQESYARNFGLQGPYTPQMVIDGRVEFNGSERARANEEIARARAREKAAVQLTRDADRLDVSIDPTAHSADVMLAIAQTTGESQVAGGENKGRHLQHVSILKNLRKIGAVKKGVAFRQTVDLPREAGTLRAIVFVQEPGLGTVYGAGMVEY
jgi:hypothetical protein